MKNWISVLVVLFLTLASVPVTSVNADGVTAVTISAPANVPPGGTFTARVNVTQVTDLNCFQLQLNYDPNKVQVVGAEGGSDGVGPGLVGSTAIPIDKWAFYPQGAPGGAIRVLGHIPSNQAASGTGYLAEIHFNVLGSIGQSATLTPTDRPTDVPTFVNSLFDITGTKITTVIPWSPVTVVVFPLLQISAPALSEAEVGEAYSLNLAAAGGVAPYTWNATGLPSGLTISGTGTISGTPTISGDFNVNINVMDSATPRNTVSKAMTLRVYPALQITTSTLPEVTKGVSYSATLAASGGKSPLNWNATGLPPGINISTAGNLSGIPTVSGDYTVNVIVTDSLSPANSTSRIVTLKIYLVGDANGDGVVTMGDVTKVERIILGLDPTTPGADANGDGNITMGDVTKIELIIMGK